MVKQAMNIIARTVGVLSVNCYIVYCKKTLAAVVIDPGGNVAEITADIHRHDLKVVGVINTHGHADHIMDNTKLRDATQAPLYIHEADAAMLADAKLNLSGYLGEAMTCSPAEKTLRDGDAIAVGDLLLRVIHTPGHTPGGICLYSGQVLFSGDTLFAESIGRTDFPGGSHRQLIDSITNKLFTLDGDTKVYPGHGSATTIDWEKKRNPFV